MQALERLKPLGLLLLRLALGITFVSHGYPKLFTNTRGAMQSFVHMGFPAYFAYISGVIEFFGGLLLIAGLFARIAGLLIVAEMAVALWKVHNIFVDPLAVHNYEFPLALAAAAFALATVGPGWVSLDHVIFGRGRKSLRKSKDHN